jgi:hypothetical protein
MPAARTRRPIEPTYTPRGELDARRHAVVDAVLKSLKTASRQFQTALLSWRDETRILERLYYKGKNQHRSALFWQRTVEARRLGTRLNDLDLSGLLDGFRASFHGAAALSK